MDRRSFLRSAALAPVSVAAVASGKSHSAPLGYERVSSEKDDPGYLAWCTLNADKKTCLVYLDGVQQKFVLTADAKEGWIKRHILSPNGNLVIGSDNNILNEIVSGVVTISIAG